jgi:O-antigen ligase
MPDYSRFRISASQCVPLGWIVVCAGLLMLGTFDLPSRSDVITGDNLDYLAMAKLATRLGTILLLTPFVLFRWHSLLESAHLRVYLMWIVLVGWACLSVLWSPLRSVTLGQAFSFGTLVLLSIATALSVRSDRDAEYVLKGITLSLATICLAVALVNLKSSHLSGLNRDDSIHEHPGLIHSTHAGATAGLALFFVAVSSLGARRFIRSPMLIAGIVVVATYVLLIAASRTALVALTAAILWVVATQLSIERRFKLIFGIAVAVAALLIVDPGLRSLKPVIGQAEAYVLRGESKQLIKSATGRQELWQVLWKSWQESPWIGYGYFVGTRDGIVDVWNAAVNRPAHNVWLQSLVSMGVVGFLLFLAAIGLIAILALRPTKALSAPPSWIRSLVLGFGIWFLIWSMMDSSVLGPVGPEPVTFFVCMGLLVASAGFQQSSSQTENATLDD